MPYFNIKIKFTLRHMALFVRNKFIQSLNTFITKSRYGPVQTLTILCRVSPEEPGVNRCEARVPDDVIKAGYQLKS
jgi:hypothetical protein